MSADKSKNQALAMALDIKRRSKKKSLKNYAEGGEAKKNYRQGAQEARKYASQKEEKGVHTPHRASPFSKESMGESYAGYTAKTTANRQGVAGVNAKTKENLSKQDMNEASKDEHRKKLEEMRAMPKPKLAEGGMLKRLKHPKMAATDAFSVRMRDEEDDLMDHDAPASPKEQPPMHDDEMDKDRQGPEAPSLKMKMMAEGGEMDMADDDMDMYADGGMIDDEEEMEHAASIAAAIMAKRKMMAEGGEINGMDSMDSDDSDEADLSRNAEEDANMEDQSSFNALKKENYSESDALDDLDSPMDSNEDSPEHDPEDINDSDIVSAIRRKMKIKSAMTK